MSVAAKAVIDLLIHYGVTYVSVVYSGNDVESVVGFRHFERLAENTEICIGLVERLNRTRSSQALDRVMGHLTTKMEMGSKVIVLWTEEADTQAILAKMHLLSHSASSDQYRQLLWISGNGWPTHGRVQNMVKDVGKWLAVRPELKPVKEFNAHFSQLRPENNQRNPWYAEYWEQMAECTADSSPAECAAMHSRMSLRTTTVIQSVYIIASSLARMFQVNRLPSYAQHYRLTIFGDKINLLFQV